MPNRPRRTPARLLAPLALVACAIAVVLVVSSSSVTSDDDGKDGGRSKAGQRTAATDTTPRPVRRFYTVKTGDTLGAIAERTGVTVERLQELNPELDPQALVAGQRIKLRE